MQTFDSQAQKLFDKADALKKQSDKVRAQAEAVLAKKYGQLGAIFAKRAGQYLPSKKKDWEMFIDRVMTVYEETLEVDTSDETNVVTIEDTNKVENVAEAVEVVAEQQLEAADEEAQNLISGEEAVVESVSSENAEFFEDEDILGSSPRNRPMRNRAFSGGLNPPEGW